MNRKDIDISVVIPTFNGEKYVCDTLESVFNQTIYPKEIVIVDDGSTDNTIRIIEKIKEKTDILIKVFSQKNKGAGAARNRGIKEASGLWIAFLDSDDIWDKNKLWEVSQVIIKNKSINLVMHDEFEKKIDNRVFLVERHKYYDPKISLFLQLYERCFFSTSCVCVKKDLLIQCGRFDEKLRSAQDYELWLKLSENCNLYTIPKALGTYINRLDNISANYLNRYNCSLIIHNRYKANLMQIVSKRKALIVILLRIIKLHIYIISASLHEVKLGRCIKYIFRCLFECMKNIYFVLSYTKEGNASHDKIQE